MKRILLELLVILWGYILILSCAATNHTYFQDGKPLGKKKIKAEAGICAGASTDYEISDTLGEPPKINIGSDIKLSPLLIFQGAGGVTENIDVGLGFGFGLVNINFRLFSKFCFLGKDNKFGIGLLPGFNFSVVPDTILGVASSDSRSMINANFHLSLPISYDFNNKFTAIIRPTFGNEWSRISVKDDDNPEDEFKRSKYFSTLVSERLTAGKYKYEWDAGNLASGVYLYRLEAGKDFRKMKKLVLLK